MLYYIVLYYICIILYYIILYYIVFYCIITLYYIQFILYYIILHYTILYYVVLYCIVFYYIILHYIILYIITIYIYTHTQPHLCSLHRWSQMSLAANPAISCRHQPCSGAAGVQTVTYSPLGFGLNFGRLVICPGYTSNRTDPDILSDAKNMTSMQVRWIGPGSYPITDGPHCCRHPHPDPASASDHPVFLRHVSSIFSEVTHGNSGGYSGNSGGPDATKQPDTSWVCFQKIWPSNPEIFSDHCLLWTWKNHVFGSFRSICSKWVTVLSSPEHPWYNTCGRRHRPETPGRRHRLEEVGGRDAVFLQDPQVPWDSNPEKWHKMANHLVPSYWNLTDGPGFAVSKF